MLDISIEKEQERKAEEDAKKGRPAKGNAAIVRSMSPEFRSQTYLRKMAIYAYKAAYQAAKQRMNSGNG